MYQVYTTEGFVLSDTPFSEESKFVTIFTKRFGLLSASVQASRSLRSKLRYHTQPLSHVEVSLVRGREVWRVVGASVINHNWASLSFEKRALLMRVFRLVRRLVQGESEGEDIFSILAECSESLKKENIQGGDLLCIETITVGRILRSLGYVSFDASYGAFLDASLIDRVLPTVPSLLISDINRALKESHL